MRVTEESSASAQIQALKKVGNQFFVVQKNYPSAIKKYSEALEVDITGAPNQEELSEERSKLFANRAECKIRLGKFEEVTYLTFST